jgi:alpha-mannosidase
VKHEVTTEIMLKKGVPIVFFETKWNNRAEDHRLEVVFSTSKKVEKTLSENHFSIVKRKHTSAPDSLPVAAGHEAALDRFPCQRFFLAEKQAFFNQGLPEYGTHENSVSITVLRAVSKLSRPRLRTRGGGAGPSLATPGANSLGENVVNYGWAPLGIFSETKTADHDQLSEAYALADQYEGPTWLLLTGGDKAETSQPFITLDNGAIRVRSMHMDQSGKSVLLRLLNVTNEPQSLTCSVDASVRAGSLTRLDGTEVAKLDCSAAEDRKVMKFSLSQNELTTLKLDI